jgi:nicotinamidase-related amidase
MAGAGRVASNRAITGYVNMSDEWDAFALLLIDVQRDFWTDEMRAAFPDYDSNVSNLLAGCRGAGIDVVHLRAAFREDQSDWMVRYRLTGSIPCIEGTPGAEVFPCAEAEAGEKVIVKQTFDGFLNPALEEHLEATGKRFLFVAGLVTSVCVLLTAASAAQRGYLVTVIDDCSADMPSAHAHTLGRYPFIFSRTTSDQLVASRDEWQGMLDGLRG